MSETSGLLPTSAPPSAEPSGSRPTPQRGQDWLLHICRVGNFVTALCALLCALACGLALFVRGEAPGQDKDPFFWSGQVLRLFGIAIAMLVMLVETEWRRFLALVPILDAWAGRGVLQVFLATLTYREAYPRGQTDIHKSLQLYRGVASVSMLCCGTAYIFGAVLCIGAIKQARSRREEALLHAAVEFEQIESRRKELERLLGRVP